MIKEELEEIKEQVKMTELTLDIVANINGFLQKKYKGMPDKEFYAVYMAFLNLVAYSSLLIFERQVPIIDLLQPEELKKAKEIISLEEQFKGDSAKCGD